MKKFFFNATVFVFLVSTSTAFADGYRGHRGGGGVSSGEVIAIGIGALFLGSVIGSASQLHQAPVQYVPVQQYAPVPTLYYQSIQVQPPTFIRGTCFVQGAYFPNGVVITMMGYFPPGTSVPPGFCFQ